MVFDCECRRSGSSLVVAKREIRFHLSLSFPSYEERGLGYGGAVFLITLEGEGRASFFSFCTRRVQPHPKFPSPSGEVNRERKLDSPLRIIRTCFGLISAISPPFSLVARRSGRSRLFFCGRTRQRQPLLGLLTAESCNCSLSLLPYTGLSANARSSAGCHGASPILNFDDFPVRLFFIPDPWWRDSRRTIHSPGNSARP